MRRRSVITVFLAVVVAGLGGCDGAAPASEPPTGGHPATLSGTSWIVTSVGGVPPVVGSRPSLTFAATRVQGSGGCNQLGGDYLYDPTTGRLRFDQLSMTAMACADQPKNDFETRFIRALGPDLLVTIGPGGELVLSGPGGQIVLVAVGPAVTD
jgi:heat shock protein HslJ